MSATTTKERYLEAVGRRKTAIARVRITEAAKSSLQINGKDLESYFHVDTLRHTVTAPITKINPGAKFKITAKVTGGGTTAQAEAIRHGLSRALLLFAPDLRKGLKSEGFLKRDPRAKERRKFGLKKARKAPQWSKR